MIFLNISCLVIRLALIDDYTIVSTASTFLGIYFRMWVNLIIY